MLSPCVLDRRSYSANQRPLTDRLDRRSHSRAYHEGLVVTTQEDARRRDVTAATVDGQAALKRSRSESK